MKSKTEWPVTTAQRLRSLRERKGLNYTKLSEEISNKCGVGISADSLANYEITATDNHSKANKVKGMNIEFLRALAEYYEVSTDWLLGISDIRSADMAVGGIVEFTGLSEENIIALHLFSHPQKIIDRDWEYDQEIAQKIVSEANQRKNIFALSEEILDLINPLMYTVATHPRGISKHFAHYLDCIRKSNEASKAITDGDALELEIDDEIVAKLNEAGFDVMPLKVGAKWHLRMIVELLEYFLENTISSTM